MSFNVINIKNNDENKITRIKEIDRQAFGDAGLDEWFIVPFFRHGMVLALRYQKEIVGSAVFLRDWDSQNQAYLFSVAIDSGYRGQGLGTRFLKECFSIIKKEGIRHVELTVDPSNHQAIKVYKEKLGFKTIEQRENEYGEGEDRLVMELDL